MSRELLGLVATAALLILLFFNIPVAVCMVLVGFTGLAILSGTTAAFSIIGTHLIASISSSTLSVLPAFLIMGEFADMSGMMRDAYKSASVWMGGLRGGLAMASILGAAAFSAVSGSSMACAAMAGRVALPSLMEHKYDPALATGTLAAGGTLGNLVPPGILLVFYAVMTETSLDKLFIACIVPGILLTVLYCSQIWVQCKINPKLGPGAGKTSWKQKMTASKDLIAVTIVFAMVMGGIWFGIYTANEAASFGTVFTFIYAVIRRTVNGHSLNQAFSRTLVTCGMSFAIIVGANIFSTFAAFSQIPQALANWLVSLNLSSLGVVILMILVYAILGIPMSPLTMLLLTMPIFLPVLIAYEINLIWFGILVVIQMELANLSPPVGLNLFVIASMAKPYNISLSTVFRGSLPFCITMLLFNIAIILFPPIAMFLVTQMR